MCWNKSTVESYGKLKDAYAFFRKIPREDLDVFRNPNYNAVRFNKLPIVGQRDGKLHAFKAQWWLIPHWAPQNKTDYPTFNARGDRIDKAPTFRTYFKGSRCLVPVSAFYEYREAEKVQIGIAHSKRKVKQPYIIKMKDDRPFVIAGVFSVWVNKETGEELPTYSVITTEPNGVLKPIHNRMPVILDEKHFERWVDREYKDTEELKKLLVPYPASKMKSYRVDAEYLWDRTNIDKKCWKEAKVPK